MGNAEQPGPVDARDLVRGCQAFRARESRDSMYSVASFLVRHFWGRPREVADGLGVLLLTWNQAFYRYGGFDFDRLESALQRPKTRKEPLPHADGIGRGFGGSHSANKSTARRDAQMFAELAKMWARQPLSCKVFIISLSASIFPKGPACYAPMKPSISSQSRADV